MFVIAALVFLTLCHDSKSTSLDKQMRKEESKVARETIVQEKQDNKEYNKAVIQVSIMSTMDCCPFSYISIEMFFKYVLNSIFSLNRSAKLNAMRPKLTREMIVRWPNSRGRTTLQPREICTRHSRQRGGI